MFPIFLIISQSVHADELQKRGYILNANGKECRFEQETVDGSHYFSNSLKSNIAVLSFTDPKCMKTDGVNEFVNISQINKAVSRWYSHSDAKFKTGQNDLVEANGLINVGYCMMSETYKSIAVSIDYQIENGAFTKVVHATGNADFC